MMKKNHLPASVLMMLGLTTGCQDCGRTHVGPCLSIAPENPEPRVRPCLDIKPTDTGVRPCLEIMPDPCLSIAPEPEEGNKPETTTPDGGAMRTPDRDQTRERVLASGVLPADVIALLQSQQEG